MSEASPPPANASEAGAPPSGSGRRTLRWVRRLLAVAAAVVAAMLLLVITIDLGRFPQVKPFVERRASDYLERPMHVGRVSATLVPGVFALDDVVIEGKHAGDRPFFTAGRIYAVVSPWTLVRRQVTVWLWLTSWHMVIENWADGSSQPRLTPKGPPSGRKSPFTVTVNVFANRGHFTYDDHLTPWSVDAPNLQFALVRAENLKQYVGTASFSGGAVAIQSYRPMKTDLSTRFVLDGPRVSLHHIDLVTDGSVSHVSGNVDFTRWPEQTYNVQSTVDFETMRGIFFANEAWRLRGQGEFTGVFHLFKGGRRLAGEFTSEDASVNGLEFHRLHGALEWTPAHFVVPHGEADLLGGETRFSYAIAPLGQPGGSTMTFTAEYRDVALLQVNQLASLKSLELAGRADGSFNLTWPSGRFGSERRGHGHTVVRAPDGVEVASAELSPVPRAIVEEPEPFVAARPLTPLPVAADVEYDLGPDGWTFQDSWAATPFTYVRFNGRLGGTGASEFPFRVTSHDWQESDRVLARIMTALAGPTSAIQVGGRGTFDGVMTGSFSAPRIAGRAYGESTRVWDVTWGTAQADVVIEGGYVDIRNSRVTNGSGGAIVADGRYALGFRRDDREEIAARVRLTAWPMVDLRHAFQLDDWPVDGVIGEADLQLEGQYRRMFGAGRLRIDRGAAWGERFEDAQGDLELEGTGLRVHRIEMRKGPGLIRGDARIGWDGTYAFQADGEAVAVEQLDAFKLEQAPLSGRLRFTATGAGAFSSPTYAFRGVIDDLFAGDQGVGRVQGQFRVAGRTLVIERVVANSGLLDVDARGAISLDELYDGTLHFRFTESSLDPYLKFVAPAISPYTRAIVSGSLDVSGPLRTPMDLTVGVTIDDAALTLYDYELRNDGAVQLAFGEGGFAIQRFALRGSDTSLVLSGGADVRGRRWHMSAAGDASLSILQLFFQGITTSGGATLNAALEGSFEAPALTGQAVVANGRLRPLASIHSLEAINGPITFDGTAIRMDGLTGRIGGGDVTFGGTVAIDGYRLSEYNLTAVGRAMRLRYPAGFTSTVNMDLVLGGPLAAPRLTGTVDVLRAQLTSGVVDGDLLGLAAAGAAGGGGTGEAGGASLAEQGTALQLDIQVRAPRMAFVNTKTARIEGSADLRIGGTFDRPSMTGAIDIAGGEWLFNGNRYFIREGSVDFANPNQVEPIFDLRAETRPRLSGQTYNIDIRITGQFDQLTPTLTSDPFLPEADILALIFGALPNADTAEQRALLSPQESQQRWMQTAMATLLASPISSRVGEVVERFSSLDTVQITPLLESEVAFQQFNPTARITLGKRIAPRVFLTYSRTVGTSALRDEIIVLEYDQNDRVSWVLSRNEDRTLALDFRIRYLR
ncbi:MAG: translocation/assembly module TamB domain-containing protein [Acidobacteria bacterium]|nr:translocation/assembly module TamB domain-containing protein [Acidobacteriota bacterium]